MIQIKNEHGVFTDRVDINGNVLETAEEYYERWLKNRNKTKDPEPTIEEQLIDPEPTIEEQLIDLAKIVIDLQYRADMKDLLENELY